MEQRTSHSSSGAKQAFSRVINSLTDRCVHVIIRSVIEDGETLNIAGDYIAHGIRHRAEMLTRDLGYQTERELQRQIETEIDAERLTRLNRTLIGHAKEGIVGLRLNSQANEAGLDYQQLLIALVLQLERIGLR